MNHPSLPHLSVSSSTPPPPSTVSPPLRIKSEPVSPPRDTHHHHVNHLLPRPASNDPGHHSPGPTLHIQPHLNIYASSPSPVHLHPSKDLHNFKFVI